MKTKLITLLIVVSSFANAGNRKDAFKKALDYCNCKIAYSYCKKYSDMNPGSAEKKSFDKINNNFKCNIGQSVSYDSINDILNRSDFSTFSKKSTAVLGRIVKEDIEKLSTEEAVSKIISGIYLSDEFKDFFLQYPELNSLREPLHKELYDYLGQSFNSNLNSDQNKIPSTDIQSEVYRLERLINDNKPNNFTINWLSIILVIIISGLVYIILKLKLSALKEIIDKQNDNINGILYNREINNNTLQNEKSKINDSKISIERNISDLNSTISSLQDDVSSLNDKVFGNTITHPKHSTPSTNIERQEKVEILYAPIPNKDGSFNASKVTNIEDQSSSFYRFTVIDNYSQTATFEFLNVERAIKSATSSPELILNPVCKIKNALNQNAKRINTLKAGMVKKENDKWILQQSAEIEYE